MEQLKSDEIITLRFAERLEVGICVKSWIKRIFRSEQNGISGDLTNEEIKQINEIIRLGNKITSGCEGEKNNPVNENQYDKNAKIIFEPGKDYKITESEFKQLKKVFNFKSNFLQMNKKIEFEFWDCPKIMEDGWASLVFPGDEVVAKKLLEDNEIKINKNKDGEIINFKFEAGRKYYFIFDDIKSLDRIFYMDDAYPFLTSDCINKNIFYMPLDILQPFINNDSGLNLYKHYHEYILEEQAKKIQELKKKKNGIEYDGIECGCCSRLIDIKQSYKSTRENIEKKAKNIDTSKSADEMNKIINNCLNEIKSKDKLVEIVTVPSKLNEYFANKAVNTINKEIKYYGFQEIQCENKLAEVFEVALDKGSLRAEDMRIILIKIKESLNEAILKEALNFLIQNILDGYLVNTKLLNAVETFLFGNSDFKSDNLKTILKNYIKPENIQDVLEKLKKLKDNKLKIYQSLDGMIECEIVDIGLPENEEIQIAIQEIVNNKSFSLSYEHVIELLEQARIPDVSFNFVDTIFATFEKAKINDDENSIKMRISNINCIEDAVQKYKLNIEDKNPLRNIMRLFFNADKIDKIKLEAIGDKISEILQEQIYTEALKKRPALLLFFDVNFLYKKIIVDPNDNIFKKTFLNIDRNYNDILLNSQNDHIAFYWKSFLGNVEKNPNNDGVTDLENYFYDFLSFAIKNINEFYNKNSALILIMMLMYKFSPEFFYKKIFPDTKDKAKDIEQKNPIKRLLGLLFEDGAPTYYAKQLPNKTSQSDVDVIIGECERVIKFKDDYYVEYPYYWVIIAHILSNLEYKPEYKDNFLYFFDLFDGKEDGKEKSNYSYNDSVTNVNAWLGLFDFVDPSFLYGNLDVIGRYLALCKEYSYGVADKLTTKNTINQICDYNHYLKYAAEPKSDEKNYFYTLLDYNEECIKYMKAEVVFGHLKDEKMECHYQWIRKNAQEKVEVMYQYVEKSGKYKSDEERNKDIFLLIEIFPDAMSKCIDAEFLIDNWDALDQNFQGKCTEGENLAHFVRGLKNISDIKKMEKWYVDLLKICPPGYYSCSEAIVFFVDNCDKFTNEAVNKCIELYKKNGEKSYNYLLAASFKEVNKLDFYCGERTVSIPKAEKTLLLIKTFGAEKAGEHIDKEFLLRNLNDKDIGDTVQECIELCAKADGRFCKSLYKVAIDERFYKNVFGEDRLVQKKKIILDLINICKEKIFEYVYDWFLMENLDNTTIKELINYASETKVSYMFDYINDLGRDDNAQIDMYYKLIKYRPDLLGVLRSSYFNSNKNFIQALNKSILEKNISVLSFLNNYRSENDNYNTYSFISNLIDMYPCDTKTQLINAIACLDSSKLQGISNYSAYIYRNCAYLKFHIDNNKFSFYKSIYNFESRKLAENLFKIHNQLNCKLNLIDLVSKNRRLCCETIDSYLPEYRELSIIIKSSYKKYLWFIGISSLVLLAIFISCFWIEILVVYFVPHISVILFCLLMSDLINVIKNDGFSIFKKIFLPRNLTEYEIKIKHEKEARHSFYSFLNGKFNFENHIGIYDQVINSSKEKNIDIKKDFSNWLKANNKDEPFNKENDRNKKIDFVVDFILRAPNNKIIKKLDGEIKKLKDFSNDNKAISLLDNWLNENQNYNDCKDVLQSEFLDMIKFKCGELKIKLKRKDNIKTLAEKIYDQIIDPQDKNLDLQNEKENEKEKEIDTSTKNIIINKDQLGENNSIPMSEVKKENQK